MSKFNRGESARTSKRSYQRGGTLQRGQRDNSTRSYQIGGSVAGGGMWTPCPHENHPTWLNLITTPPNPDGITGYHCCKENHITSECAEVSQLAKIEAFPLLTNFADGGG